VSKRRKKISGSIAYLVVEGNSDERLWKNILGDTGGEIFPAGNRTQVEGLLVHLDSEPIEGCSCVFLTDCDGRGKAKHLKQADELVVTQCCDIEADSVALGLMTRAIMKLVDDTESASEIVRTANRIGLSVSRVRRAAAREYVSMKKAGRWLSLRQLGWPTLRQHLRSDDPDVAISKVVGEVLGWSYNDYQRVLNRLGEIPAEFERTCNGKDVYEATLLLLDDYGVPGLTLSGLKARVWKEYASGDAETWVVAKRLMSWQEKVGCEVVVLEDGSPKTPA
jgi:hypothetical protein